MRPGDRVILINSTQLERVSLGGQLGKIAILDKRLTQEQIRGRAALQSYEIAWWVTLENDLRGTYAPKLYVPEQCLIPYDGSELHLGPSKQTETRKENHVMALFAITILKTPSVKAQEAGEMETIIVPGTEVVAHDTSAGICLVSAANAEKINALKEEGAKIRVIARNLG